MLISPYTSRPHRNIRSSRRTALKPDRKPDRGTIAAYHEAGHAVVAWDQGVRVHGISVVPDEGRMGHIAIDTLHLNRLAVTFPSNKGARNRFTMERHVMVLQGGLAAVRRLDQAGAGLEGKIRSEGSDPNIAMGLVRAFATSEQEAEKYYQWLDSRTAGIMANPMRWHQVQALAEALLELKQLGAKKVREIIREAGEKWCRDHEDPD